MKKTFKSLILGTSLLLTIPLGNAFDFQMPGEETPRRSSKKVPSKKGNLPRSKAGRKAQKIKREAKKKASQAAARPAPKGIQAQIRLLNEKIDRLEAGQSPTATVATSSESETGERRGHPLTRAGYIPVPGTNTAIRIGGYIKADAVYDASQFTGDASNLPNLRLRTLDADAARTNVWTGHVKQSRIVLGSETHTAEGRVMTYFEGDFFGSMTTSSSSGSFNRSDTSSLNSYAFRVRHAYGSYCYQAKHRIDVGQMWTLFYDPKSAGTTVEFNGPETTAQIRRPQVRYTYAHKRWKFSASLESGATDYLDISPAFVGSPSTGLTAGSPNATYNTSQYRRAQSPFLGGISGDGNQALPDIVGQAHYEKKKVGHFTVGVMVRQLKVNKVTSTGPGDPPFSSSRLGYGFALGGRRYLGEKSNIFAQLNFGKGIGTYIFGLNGYSAAVDTSRGLMQAQFAYGLLFGVEHYWAEKWRSNMIFSVARANVASFIPKGRTAVIGLNNGARTPLANTGYSISNMLRQFYLNLLWAPVEKFEVGLEYAHFRRDTINDYFGYGNRFQLGAYYKF